MKNRTRFSIVILVMLSFLSLPLTSYGTDCYTYVAGSYRNVCHCGTCVDGKVNENEPTAVANASGCQLLCATTTSCSKFVCPTPNTAPAAGGVSCTNPPAVGATLTGSYTFADTDDDREGTSTFKWYRAINADGAEKTEISGATAKTYKVQGADIGKFICFEVTPVALSGISPGVAIASCTAAAVPINAAPTAAVSITGSDCLTGMLTGSYVYDDADNPKDEEDTANTKFQWYTGTDYNCSGKQAISGATSKTYTQTVADKGKFLCFGVIPAAKTGMPTGSEAFAYTPAAADTPVYASVPTSKIEFATVKSSSANKTLTVTNAGTGTLSISKVEISNVSSDVTGSFEVLPTTADIACPGSKPFTITCNGKEEGTLTATMTVTHNAAGGTATYLLSCEVKPSPAYSSSPAPSGTLSMTSCTPADVATTLTVTNTGTDDLKITRITIGGTNKDGFSVSPMAAADKPLTVAAGKHQPLTITGYGKTVGTFTGTLEITHNAPDGSKAAYKLSSVISDCYVASYVPANQAPVADKLSLCTDGNNPVSVTLTGSDADATNWFMLLLKPVTYSVVTQPKNGTLTGTAPNIIYTPNPGFIGTDAFTFRAYDGTAYSEPATVSLATTAGGCFCVSDSFDMNVSCAEFQGVRYGFTLNHLKPADDPSGLYWKVNTAALRNAPQSAGNCISIGNDFKLNIPCARYQGAEYGFTMDYSKPPGSDPFELYWKMNTDTLKKR